MFTILAKGYTVEELVGKMRFPGNGLGSCSLVTIHIQKIRITHKVNMSAVT